MICFEIYFKSVIIKIYKTQLNYLLPLNIYLIFINDSVLEFIHNNIEHSKVSVMTKTNNLSSLKDFTRK